MISSKKNISALAITAFLLLVYSFLGFWKITGVNVSFIKRLYLQNMTKDYFNDVYINAEESDEETRPDIFNNTDKTSSVSDILRTNASTSLNLTMHNAQNTTTRPTKTAALNQTQFSGNETDTQPVKALIWTRYRSGSSFIGEIFSHHPDIYYLFEPFLIFISIPEGNHSSVNNVGLPMLNKLYNCDLSDMDRYLRKFPILKKKWSRIFCNNLVLERNGIQSLYDSSCNHPGSFTSVKSTMHICEAHRHIVTKTIRVRNITTIKGLLDDNVKVINLIRDPRGQIPSIMDIYRKYYRAGSRLTNSWVEQKAEEICDDLSHSLNKTEQLLMSNPHLRNKYKFVRYEDVALNPLEKAEEMYKFLGIKFSPEVRDWIKFATKTSSGKTYGTTRKSNEVAFSWRRKLQRNKIYIIQNKCEQLLTKLGYAQLKESDNLKIFNPILNLPISFSTQ